MSFYTNVQLLGNTILYRGYEGGERIESRFQFSPTLFITSNKEEKWKTLTGRNVKPVKFNTVREARDFAEKYHGVEGVEVHGYDRYLYQFLSKEFKGEIDYRMDQMKIYTIDIEVACENGFPDVDASAEEMLCITIRDHATKKTITWGIREFESEHEHHIFDDEKAMLAHFINWWAQNTPDIITGWNCNLYDIPYICRRVDRILGEKWMKSLSPWNKVDEEEVYIQGRRNIYYDICGVSILDYLDLYKKFTYTNRESYRLDYIANVELGQKKLDWSEHENFKAFYTNDWQKFIEYNIIDVELVDRLEDKMKLLELAITMAYDAKVNFDDVYSQVRMWDTMIYNYLKKKNFVVPPKKRSSKNEKYAGAYVKEPKPGRYDWVVNFDLNSLYPHLIMQYNISPETLWETRHGSASVEGILNKEIEVNPEFATCANGAQYRKDVQGFLPLMMQKMYDSRVIFKKKMIKAKQEYEKNPSVELTKEIARCNNIQMAKKISLNSAYGAIGNEHFRYYRLANAEAITLSGQVSIRWIENKMNSYLNSLLQSQDIDYVIASDTDSIYLNLGPLVDKFFSNKSSDKARIVALLDKICQDKLEPFIDSCYKELASYVSAYDQKMIMKRENIADRGIWTAKKRYILNVWDSEGVRYKEPKMKIMGLETARSSTPAYFRDKLYAAFKIIIGKTNDELISFINDVRTETRERPYEEVAFPRGVNNLEKYRHRTDIYSKGTPIHVRGALLYNHYVKKHKIENKFPFIQEGEKIKFMYLKTPNPLHENCISFFGELPKEFGIEKYVDYQTQFEKSFLEPLKNVLQCIGWEHEKRITLRGFFE